MPNLRRHDERGQQSGEREYHALVLHCGVLEWCILLGCVGLVMTAELFNSAVETLFRGLDEATKERVWPCLDIAAGAVLLASIVSAIIGTIIFVRQLLNWPA